MNPGKDAEHRKWWDEEGRKVMQAMVDTGLVKTYYRLRAVVPSGASAACDNVTVAIYPGIPPEPASREQFESLLKKAGIASADEFAERRDATRKTVSNEIFQNQFMLGSMKKGDYLAVSYMKAAHIDEWLNMEKTIWQPIADAMIKEGVESGWSVNLAVLPSGDDMPYQGVTVDVYPSWQAVFQSQNDTGFEARFKKVHPGMDINTTLEKALKTRSQSMVYLFQVEDVIESGK